VDHAIWPTSNRQREPVGKMPLFSMGGT
jgi:hypothetical protein